MAGWGRVKYMGVEGQAKSTGVLLGEMAQRVLLESEPSSLCPWCWRGSSDRGRVGLELPLEANVKESALLPLLFLFGSIPCFICIYMWKFTDWKRSVDQLLRWSLVSKESEMLTFTNCIALSKL